MKVVLTGSESLRVEPTSGQLTIEAPTADMSYGPFHMLGSSLAMCTFSVLQSWATNRNLGVDDLRVDVSWSFVEQPHRVGAMKLTLEWPSLAADMWPRAIRVANLCGVHNTLTHSPAITIEPADAPSMAGAR
ncbi:MAG TPA: OsmC family protein [Gemmatimonadaceae bacterium]|nr:OsmC family protein [Gemmatimonadaceae bacterium]